MSIKLYEGLKVKDEYSQDIFSITKTIHNKLSAVQTIIAKEKVYEKMVSIIDRSSRDQDFNKDNVVFVEALTEYDQDSNSGFPSIEKIDTTIYFGKTTTTGKILAYPVVPDNRYIEALKETGIFEEYGYWDNTDKPDNISENEWVLRGKEWEEISMDNSFLPLLNYTLKNENPFSLLEFFNSEKDITELNEIITPEYRRRKVLFNQVFSTLIEKRPLTTQRNLMTNFSLANEIINKMDKNLEINEIPLPEKIVGKISSTIADFPPVYTINENIIDRYVEENPVD